MAKLLIKYYIDLIKIWYFGKIPIMFAEETNIFFANRNITELFFQTNCQLKKISAWFKEKNMPVK